MERETGFEPATPSLEGWCSSQLSYSRPKTRDGGGRRIRTSVGQRPADLQSAPFNRFGIPPVIPFVLSTGAPSPLLRSPSLFAVRRERTERSNTCTGRAIDVVRRGRSRGCASGPDSRPVRRCLRFGCERAAVGGFDLVLSSSLLFSIRVPVDVYKDGAGEGTRTLNLRITNPVLYQLSYASPDPDTRRPPTREAFVGRNAFVRVAVRSPGRVRNR